VNIGCQGILCLLLKLVIVCVRYNRCHGNAVKEFWTLWDYIYERVFTVSESYGRNDGQFTSLKMF
jgi:hypothetical protein